MPSFISKLFSKSGDADFSKLREVIEQNKKDREWVDAFTAKSNTAKTELERMFSEFREAPSDALATAILKFGTKYDAEKDILAQLAQFAVPATQQMILARTVPVLREALETVKAKLEVELTASQQRDVDFDGEGIRGLGGEVSSGYRSPGDIKAAIKSSATRFLEGTLQRANNYLTRLDSLTVNELRGPIDFCLGK